MLVQAATVVDVPVDEVELALARPDRMALWADAAYRRGERLAVGIPGVAVAVELEVGEPLRGSDAVTVPFAWRAAGSERLFPHMEAELVLRAASDERTEVVFRGRYRPPLANVGEVLDRLAMHHLAEATVRTFLDRLTDALEARGGGGSQPDSRRDLRSGTG